MPEDSFYIDAGTADPFEALERYGRALRKATGAKPNPYDFPTVCAWFAGCWKGMQRRLGHSKYHINTTAGLVEEAQKMQASGFLKYSRAAGRLVPDTYTPYNPQGWWDDKHWQRRVLLEPFETAKKFGKGMHRQGALAFTYIQPVIQPPAYKNRICKDFRDTHAGWLLKNSWHDGLDYSMPEVQEHMRERFSALRGTLTASWWITQTNCGSPSCTAIRRTPDWPPPHLKTLTRKTWAIFNSRGSQDDRHRLLPEIFSLLRDLGPNAWIHERNLEQPNNDITFGIVDSQRTLLDSDKISPDYYP